jgi:hypothetical protein
MNSYTFINDLKKPKEEEKEKPKIDRLSKKKKQLKNQEFPKTKTYNYK